ncbi:hypothetical protein BH11PLA1_BH11PLA1_11790 [soil metagenome]
MVEAISRTSVGEYHLIRPLPRGPRGERWLAARQSPRTSHILHALEFSPGLDAEAGHSVVEAAVGRSLPHTLDLQQVLTDDAGQVWAVTPFTGDHDGLVTLYALLRKRGGYLDLDETKRAMEQLLAASVAAHARGAFHGPIAMNEVLVDRAGSLLIEHYGLGLQLAHAAAAGGSEITVVERREHCDAEIRSVLEIGYQLATGLAPDRPLIPITRILLDADRSWSDLFETGLHAPGFASAAHAASAAASVRAARRSVPAKKMSVLGLFSLGLSASI